MMEIATLSLCLKMHKNRLIKAIVMAMAMVKY
jgi:hypothetical protein